MNIDHIGSVLSAVLLIVSVAAAAWGALNRETLRTVRESNKDLQERVSILEAAEVRHTATISTLTTENETLRSVITNETHLVAIEDLIDAHHKSAERHWQLMNHELSAIRIALERGNP